MRQPVIKLFLFVLFCVCLDACPLFEKKSEEKKEDTSSETATQQLAKSEHGLPLEVIAEVEPNQKTSQAMKINKSCVVEATLEAAPTKSKRAADWYKIETEGPRRVAVETTGIVGDDVVLVFLDADRNELFRVDSTREGGSEVFPNLSVTEGFYLKVAGNKGGSGGPYKLKIQLREPAQAGEEIENNGRYSQATEINAGQPIQGYLSHHHDEDWFECKLADMPTGAIARIDLSSVEGVRFDLELLDSEERRPILEAKSASIGEGIVLRNVGIPPSAKGIYIVLKSSWVPGDKPKKFVRTANPNSPYTLTVSFEAGGDDLEREPNDSYKDAMKIADGQKIRGFLSHANDSDWYSIEVEQPSLMSAELSALERVDLQLYVIDPEKKEETRNNYLVRINDGKVNEAEVLSNCAVAPGTNYLKVEGAYKKVDNKWIRDAYNLEENYELTIFLRTDDGREEREPNGNTEKATPIAVGETKRGTLHPIGDVDVYKLDLSSQAGPITTTIECIGIPKVDIRLALLGPEMNEKGRHKEIISTNKGRGEEKELISQELMPGEYWLVVKGPKYSRQSNSKDQYVLTVTQ